MSARSHNLEAAAAVVGVFALSAGELSFVQVYRANLEDVEIRLLV